MVYTDNGGGGVAMITIMVMRTIMFLVILMMETFAKLR